MACVPLFPVAAGVNGGSQRALRREQRNNPPKLRRIIQLYIQTLLTDSWSNSPHTALTFNKTAAKTNHKSKFAKGGLVFAVYTTNTFMSERYIRKIYAVSKSVIHTRMTDKQTDRQIPTRMTDRQIELYKDWLNNGQTSIIEQRTHIHFWTIDRATDRQNYRYTKTVIHPRTTGRQNER